MTLYESSTLLSSTIPTTSGVAYTPLYQVKIPSLMPGQIVQAFCVAEVTSRLPQAIMVGSQMFFLGSPISPTDVQDASDEHLTIERHAIYQVGSSWTDVTVTLYGWACSDNYPLGTPVTVESPGYGKLSVLVHG